jgi:hypothetical protein
MMYLQKRDPLTEEEVIAMLDEEVADTVKQWGEDYIYSRWARENREKKLEKFRNGEVIEVKCVSYSAAYGNGTGNYDDVLMSDGTVKTYCYGYYD